jgi:hypothetical protein
MIRPFGGAAALSLIPDITGSRRWLRVWSLVSLKHTVDARNAYTEFGRYCFFCVAVTLHLHELRGHRPGSRFPPSVLAFGLSLRNALPLAYNGMGGLLGGLFGGGGDTGTAPAVKYALITVLIALAGCTPAQEQQIITNAKTVCEGFGYPPAILKLA